MGVSRVRAPLSLFSAFGPVGEATAVLLLLLGVVAAVGAAGVVPFTLLPTTLPLSAFSPFFSSKCSTPF